MISPFNLFVSLGFLMIWSTSIFAFALDNKPYGNWSNTLASNSTSTINVGFLTGSILTFKGESPQRTNERVFQHALSHHGIQKSNFMTNTNTLSKNLSSVSFAHSAYSKSNRLNLQFFKALFMDTGYVLSSPARWNKKDWLTFAAVSGIATGLYFMDAEVRDWSQRDQTNTGAFFADVGTYLGSGTNVIVMFSGFYVVGELFKNTKARRTALLGFESALITSLVTQSMKFAFHRHRPHTGDPPDRFDGPSLKSHNLSFPSGHSTAAFSIATVIANEYNQYAIVPPIAYGLALLTAFSRVHKNVHWSSDVFVGFSIGFFTSKTVLKLHQQTHNVVILPELTENSLGVVMSSRF